MRFSVLASVLMAFAGLAGTAQADYPERPVTIIVPAAAGGGGDTTTRILARELKDILGQPIDRKSVV